MKTAFLLLIILSIHTIITNSTYELEVGPYEVTEDETATFERVDIAEDEAGVALQYIITVKKNGSLLSGMRLDTWSANAAGLYSGIASDGTQSEEYLRGWQTTNSSGVVTFTAIYPGAYSDRTTHVHFRLRMFDTDGVTTTYDNTTQLFFPQDITNEVMALSTYSTTDWNTVNSNDRLYVVDNQVTLTGSITEGFVATYTIEIPLEVSTSTTTTTTSTTSSTTSSSTSSSTSSTSTSSTTSSSFLTKTKNSHATQISFVSFLVCLLASILM